MSEVSERSELNLHPDALQGVAGQIVQAIEPHSEADPAALLATILARSSAVIGANAYLPVSAAARQVPRLYAVIVGRSSRARKGTTEADIRGIFAGVDPWFDSECTVSGLSSGEGLIARLESAGNDVPDIDVRLLVIEPEFARVLAAAKRDGSILSPVIRDLYDRGEAACITRAAPLNAKGHVVIVGHSTVEELRARLTTLEVSNGFANRFVIVHASRSKRLAHGGSMSEDEREHVARIWQEAISRGRTIHGRVTRSDTAAAEWEAFYESLDDEVFGLYGTLVARAESHVARLSLVYALLDGSNVIQLAHHRAAVAMWNYCEASVRQIWPPNDTSGDPDTDCLFAALRERGELSRVDISRLFTGHRSGAEIDALIERNSDRLDERIVSTQGRPKSMYKERDE